ncbi:hypothetical protein GCM10027280_35220 [Micromonospora polyrhachis]
MAEDVAEYAEFDAGWVVFAGGPGAFGGVSGDPDGYVGGAVGVDFGDDEYDLAVDVEGGFVGVVPLLAAEGEAGCRVGGMWGRSGLGIACLRVLRGGRCGCGWMADTSWSIGCRSTDTTAGAKVLPAWASSLPGARYRPGVELDTPLSGG